MTASIVYDVTASRSFDILFNSTHSNESLHHDVILQNFEYCGHLIEPSCNDNDLYVEPSSHVISSSPIETIMLLLLSSHLIE